MDGKHRGDGRISCVGGNFVYGGSVIDTFASREVVIKLMYRGIVLCSWLLGIALIAWRTEGLQVVSTEGARRSAVQQSPLILSDWLLEVDGSQERQLSALSAEHTLLVNFIYTRCPTVCRAQGGRFAELQRELSAAGRTDVKLLSVTIDPSRDSHERLAAFRDYHRGDSANWWMVRARDDSQLDNIKRELGVRVIDDSWGGFAHTEALHAIQDGRLVAIIDWDSLSQLESVL